MQKQIDAHIHFFAETLERYKSQKLKVFASSSFQSHSIPMLHIISRLQPNIPIYFLQTGFHFAETIRYKNQIADWLGLEVIEVSSPIPKIQQITADGQLMFASQPDYCCYLNKTLPMEPIISKYDVWITGVRRDQNENRKKMDHEMPGKNGVLRFHPMLDWTEDDILYYTTRMDIPPHPLEQMGYYSVGCEPCTQKTQSALSIDRNGRWSGMKKTECGLHTDLIKEKK